MKKLFAFCLLLAFVCGMAFADEDGEDGGKDFLHIQVGASIMYKQPINYVFSYGFFYNFRGGITADVLFSLGILEIGAEIGGYGMEVDYGYGYYFLLEIPIDALVRLNLSKDRSFALEVRAGGWLVVDTSGYPPEMDFNGGARLVIGTFYIGGDFIYSPAFSSCWSAEAGVKFSF